MLLELRQRIRQDFAVQHIPVARRAQARTHPAQLGFEPGQILTRQQLRAELAEPGTQTAHRHADLMQEFEIVRVRQKTVFIRLPVPEHCLRHGEKTITQRDIRSNRNRPGLDRLDGRRPGCQTITALGLAGVFQPQRRNLQQLPRQLEQGGHRPRFQLQLDFANRLAGLAGADFAAIQRHFDFGIVQPHQADHPVKIGVEYRLQARCQRRFEIFGPGRAGQTAKIQRWPRHRVFDLLPRMQPAHRTAAAFQRLQPVIAIAAQAQADQPRLQLAVGGIEIDVFQVFFLLLVGGAQCCRAQQAVGISRINQQLQFDFHVRACSGQITSAPVSGRCHGLQIEVISILEIEMKIR